MRNTSPILLTLVALAALAVAADALRGSADERHRSAQRYEDVYYLPPSDWLGPVSLGWREALADLLWMRGLVYFGDEMIHGGSVRHVFDYADAMTTLDPRFSAVYHWVGTAALYHPGEVSPEEMERAARFMERGARVLPDDGRLAWDIGATWAFEIAPTLRDEEAAAYARERGAQFMMAASRRGAAPEWAVLSNASLLARVGRDAQAAEHLEEMYLAVNDPETRAQIAERIRELRDRAQAEGFLGAARELEERRRRDFPYLPPTMYLLVGPRPPLDTIAPLRDGFARALAE